MFSQGDVASAHTGQQKPLSYAAGLAEFLSCCGVRDIVIREWVHGDEWTHLSFDEVAVVIVTIAANRANGDISAVFEETSLPQLSVFLDRLKMHFELSRALKEWVLYQWQLWTRELFPAGPCTPHSESFGMFAQRISARGVPDGVLYWELHGATSEEAAARQGQHAVHQLTRDYGANLMYHATTHSSAMDILVDGFDITCSERKNDFGRGVYMNRDFLGACSWAYSGHLTAHPAIIVYRPPDGAVWFSLDAISTPSWQEVVDGNKLDVKADSYCPRQFPDSHPAVEGAQACKVGEDWCPSSANRQHVILDQDMAKDCGKNIIAVLFFAPSGYSKHKTRAMGSE